jgi:hypothetical protein
MKRNSLRFSQMHDPKEGEETTETTPEGQTTGSEETEGGGGEEGE